MIFTSVFLVKNDQTSQAFHHLFYDKPKQGSEKNFSMLG